MRLGGLFNSRDVVSGWKITVAQLQAAFNGFSCLYVFFIDPKQMLNVHELISVPW